jgi:SAM-dependent methyltransferase
MSMTIHTGQGVAGQYRSDATYTASYDYVDYWRGREYEHAAEEIALRALLDGWRFRRAVDVGGGYGRLCPLLAEYADRVTLAEPSASQLAAAERYLAGHPEVERRRVPAHALGLEDASVDLVTMVRVMHHLPDPAPVLAELARVLAPGGRLVLEVANATHALNRLRFAARGRRVPRTPVPVASLGGAVPFVNHHPETVAAQLANFGLEVERALSVSNLRSPLLKRVVPAEHRTAVERRLQPALARVAFGPSLFLLVRPVAGRR